MNSLHTGLLYSSSAPDVVCLHADASLAPPVVSPPVVLAVATA
ncbi:hypothetical protein ACFQDN_19595 [Pseudomonas asuensis]|jgi:hypothetical protein|nr:hypothetical protein [Pseudomonas asuensis]